MSLERTPPLALPPSLPSAPVCIEPSSCQICHETMNEGEDGLIIEECSHSFHRTCIETHLSTSSECPICKRPCQLNELRKLIIAPKSVPSSRSFNTKSRGHGTALKQYNTRSTTRNLFTDQQTNWQNLSLGAQGGHMQTPERNTSLLSQQQIVSNPIDYGEINRVIESNISRILQNFTIIPTVSHNINHDNLSHIDNVNRPTNPPQGNGNTNISNTFSPNILSNASTSSMPSDKITSIIQSWNLKFDGSSTH